MHRHKLILVVSLLLPLVVRSDSPIQGPLKLLAQADRMALLYNWPVAAPRYSEAESLFAESGDAKNALAARLGYIWSTADGAYLPRSTEKLPPILRILLSDPIHL